MRNRVPIMNYALPLLSREEEQLLVRKAKAGCEQSKEKFLRHNIPLVTNIVIRSNIHIPAYDLEDLIAIGCAAMVKAFNYFKPERGLKFSTVAALIIKQDLWTERRRYGFGHGVKLTSAEHPSKWEEAVKKIHTALADVVSLDAIPKDTELPSGSVSDFQAEEALDESLFLSDVDRALNDAERALVRALLDGKTNGEYNLENGIRENNRWAIIGVKEKLEWVRA